MTTEQEIRSTVSQVRGRLEEMRQMSAAFNSGSFDDEMFKLMIEKELDKIEAWIALNESANLDTVKSSDLALKLQANWIIDSIDLLKCLRDLAVMRGWQPQPIEEPIEEPIEPIEPIETDVRNEEPIEDWGATAERS